MVNHECANRFHLKPQSNISKRFCRICDSFVSAEIIGKKKCPCCGAIMHKIQKHITTKTILNKSYALLERYIDEYNRFPIYSNDVKLIIQVKNKQGIYNIPIYVLARYVQALENNSVRIKNEFWSTTMHDSATIQKVLGYCENRINMVGVQF